jgi:hypothetical protein
MSLNCPYVVDYNAKYVINKFVFIGTNEYVILVPKIHKSGTSLKHVTKTFYVGDKSIEDVLCNLLNQDLSIEELLKQIEQWQIPDTVVLNIKELKDFKVSKSWLTKLTSIVYKKQTDKGWKMLCSISKKESQKVYDFYQKIV